MNGVNQYFISSVQEHTWQVNDKKVTISKFDGEILWQVSDINGQNLAYDIIDRIGLSVDVMFECLKNDHRVIVNSNNCALFRRPICQYQMNVNYTPYNMSEGLTAPKLSLLKAENELVWQLSVGSFAIQQSFRATYPSRFTDDNTRYLFDQIIKNPSINKILSDFFCHGFFVNRAVQIKNINYVINSSHHDFGANYPLSDIFNKAMNIFYSNRYELSDASTDPHFASVKTIGNPYRAFIFQNLVNSVWPFYVTVETKRHQSPFYSLHDLYCSFDKAFVSRYTWQVRGVTRSGCFGQHFEILIEGLNNGYANLLENGQALKIDDYFMIRAHFNGPRVAIKVVKNPDKSKRKIIKKSEAWERPSILVNQMLGAIIKERTKKSDLKQGQRNINTPEISFFGHDSIFSRGKQSCCSWAKNKMKIINIDIDNFWTKWFNKVITIPRWHI